MELENFKVVEQIGRGEFGTVYSALKKPHDTRVAIKFLHSKFVRIPGFIERLKHEANFSLKTQHENIVPIHEIGQEGKFWYLLMPIMSGGSLQDIFDRNRYFEPDRAVMIFNQVARGLEHAHRQGVIHRDLKPSNILFDEYGVAKISDFGFAKIIFDELRLPAGTLDHEVGSPYYTAPELWQGGLASQKSDQYSLGCILYEMLTGSKLFDGETTTTVMSSHFRTPVFTSGLPQAFSEIIFKAVQKKPSDRFATLDEMREAINSLAKPNPIKPVETVPAPKKNEAIKEKATHQPYSRQTQAFPQSIESENLARPLASKGKKTVPEVIAEEKSYLKEKKQKPSLLWLIGSIAILFIAIVAGLFLVRSNRAKQARIEALANITPETIVYTAVPLPTFTPVVHVAAGSIRANGVGFFDPDNGYQILDRLSYEGQDFPKWSIADFGGVLQDIQVGDTHAQTGELDIQTFSDLGVMMSVGKGGLFGGPLENSELYVYGGSSLTLKNDQGVTDIALRDGTIYLQMSGSTERADIVLPNHGDARVRINGGTALLNTEPDKVVLWCLQDECEIEVGADFRRLSSMTIQTYTYHEGKLADVETFDPVQDIERNEVYLFWNNHCNGCLGFEPVPEPTPTPRLTQSPIDTPTPINPIGIDPPTKTPSATPTVTQYYDLAIITQGRGFVNLSPPGGTYAAGTSVTLTAIPESGWKFVRWDGDLYTSANPVTITMGKRFAIIAVFEEIQSAKYTLSMNVYGEGYITITPPGGTYDAGTTVTISASPASGWEFVGWSGDASGSANPISVTMTKNMHVTANFKENRPQHYSLTVVANPAEGGSVSGGGTYDAGATVMIVASPASGWEFVGWSGDASGSAAATTVVMDKDKSVTANFKENRPQQFTLTVVADLAAGGSVSGGEVYDAGTVASIMAMPAPGWEFVGWSGDGSGSHMHTTVMMDSNKMVISMFVRTEPKSKPSLKNPQTFMVDPFQSFYYVPR